MAIRLESAWLISDTGVLETFAAAGDVAWRAFWLHYRDRVHWTDAVRDEVRLRIRSGETSLIKVQRAPWPAAIDLSTPEDQAEVDAMRERLRRENDPPTKHVGEAATIVAALHTGAVAAIDDADGYTLAKTSGLKVVRGLELMIAVVNADGLTCHEAWEAYARMRGHSRLPDIPRSQLCPPACGRHRPAG